MRWSHSEALRKANPVPEDAEVGWARSGRGQAVKAKAMAFAQDQPLPAAVSRRPHTRHWVAIGACVLVAVGGLGVARWGFGGDSERLVSGTPSAESPVAAMISGQDYMVVDATAEPLIRGPGLPSGVWVSTMVDGRVDRLVAASLNPTGGDTAFDAVSLGGETTNQSVGNIKVAVNSAEGNLPALDVATGVSNGARAVVVGRGVQQATLVGLVEQTLAERAVPAGGVGPLQSVYQGPIAHTGVLGGAPGPTRYKLALMAPGDKLLYLSTYRSPGLVDAIASAWIMSRAEIVSTERGAVVVGVDPDGSQMLAASIDNLVVELYSPSLSRAELLRYAELLDGISESEWDAVANGAEDPGTHFQIGTTTSTVGG